MSASLGAADWQLDLFFDYELSFPLDESKVLAPLCESEFSRATSLVKNWRLGRVSRWNHLREYSGLLPSSYVLVIDQYVSDPTLNGEHGAESFNRMLDAALAENPKSDVVVLINPKDTAKSRHGRSNFAAFELIPRVVLQLKDVHPVRLIEESESVYLINSPLGFEALLWGKPVRTFGMPFYAGWGLTHDDFPPPEQQRQLIPLESLVHAAIIQPQRYVDPETGVSCEPERLIEWLSLQRRMRERFSENLGACGFSGKKKSAISRFLQGSAIKFMSTCSVGFPGYDYVVWGCAPVPQGLASSQKLVRVEDGFIRSVGLGAEFVPPLSLVMDGRGIYYDVSKPSELEHLLMTTAYEDSLLKRARSLRQKIVDVGLTKYNVGSGGWHRPATGARVILVPGQVESDASIKLGAPEGICSVRRNVDLLKAVRKANPDAYIVYKPHPDVLAGLRKRGVDEREALQWCDEQVLDVPMNVMLSSVDEVHVITSLAGFEALLRGKKVVCYGQPFYAGWGLTHDKVPITRRTRHLSMDELVAGTLILYPTYVSRKTHRFTTPERALQELQSWRGEQKGGISLWRRLYRFYLGIYRY